MKVANIVNVDRAVTLVVLSFKRLIQASQFLEYANIKWHFTEKVSYASTINQIYHLD